MAQQPTRRPTTFEPPPEQNVTPAPSPQPSLRPTGKPSTGRLTNIPTSRPTRTPTSRPTRRKRPTPSPTSPTLAPASAKLTSAPTLKPTQRSLENTTFETVIVPISFDAELLTLQDPEVLVTELETTWESYINARLKAAYRNDDSTFVDDVNLTVSLLSVSEGGSTRLLLERFLQQSSGNGTSVKVQADGPANFAVDTSRQTTDSFTSQAQDELDLIITQQSLQQALLLANNAAIVKSVENNSREEPEPYYHKPTTVEIVIGFLLLTLSVIALFCWARILWRKRQKRLQKRRREEAMRKASFGVVARPPPPATSQRQQTKTLVSPTSTGNGPTQLGASRTLSSQPTARADSSSDDSLYEGLGDSEDDEESDMSEFGKELRMAASLDQAAWEEFQRKKQEYGIEPQRNVRSATGGVDTSTVSPVVLRFTDPSGNDPRDYNSYNDGDRSGLYEEGLEVDVMGIVSPASRGDANDIQRINSFPYGDEKVFLAERSPNAAGHMRGKGPDPVELSLKDAVEWTPTGISLKVPPGEPSEEDGGNFEPYGENNGGRNLEQSWDLDAVPVVDTDGPSQYSFLYPLKRQQLSDNTQASPSGTTDTRSSAAVNANTTVSSWSTSGAVIPTKDQSSHVDRDDVIYEEKSQSSSDSEDDIITSEMLKEVSRLSQFVKHYEQRKELAKMVETEESEEKGKEGFSSSFLNVSSLNTTSVNNSAEESKSTPTGQYEQLDDTLSAQRIAAERASQTKRPNDSSSNHRSRLKQPQYPQRVSQQVEADDPSVEQYESSSEDEKEDAAAGRLGIGRYRVQRPPAPILAYSANKEVDQLGGAASQVRPKSLSLPPPKRAEKNQQAKQSSRGGLESGMASQTPLVRPGAVSRSGALSSSRKSADREEISEATGTKKSASSSPLPPAEVEVASSPKSKGLKTKGSTPLWTRGANPSPRTKSKNNSFNNIVTMFEAKPKNAVVPPNEHVSIALL